jgi:hypothetical protein
VGKIQYRWTETVKTNTCKEERSATIFKLLLNRIKLMKKLGL